MKEKVRSKDYLLVISLFFFIVALLLIPTGFENIKLQNSETVRARVIDVDNSSVMQFGIVKTGDQDLEIRILNGRFKGVEVNANNMLIGKMELDKMFAPGDSALVVLDLDNSGEKIIHANVIDHYRIRFELILFGIFVLLLLGFAGWTGLKAVLSFLFTAVVIWKLLIPGFLKGWDPILLTLGIVMVLTAAIIFLVGGLTTKGIVAFLGAFLGILLTCGLSILFDRGFRIHGAVRPFSETLLYSGFPHLDLKKIFLSGIFLASSGAVMDLAMDISAAMQEVREKHPQISRKELVFSGFTVAKAVIGTMTTTLLFAYSGGYTAMLMVFMAQGTPVVNMFNIIYVSSEVMHTLVGSFGLVTVAPFTAIIGGIIYVRKIGDFSHKKKRTLTQN